MFKFKKIKFDLNLIYIIFALFFSLQPLFNKFNYYKINFPYVFKKNLNEKYMMIDGEFYKFISFCKDIIPSGSEVIFYNSWSIYQEIYPNNAQFMFTYHKQKSIFYFYPIKTYSLGINQIAIGIPWAIPPEHENEILKRVSFIVAYYLDRDFPGFKIQYRYNPNHYILIKEK